MWWRSSKSNNDTNVKHLVSHRVDVANTESIAKATILCNGQSYLLSWCQRQKCNWRSMFLNWKELANWLANISLRQIIPLSVSSWLSSQFWSQILREHNMLQILLLPPKLNCILRELELFQQFYQFQALVTWWSLAVAWPLTTIWPLAYLKPSATSWFLA